MRKVYKLIGWLSLIVFVITLFGYFILDWKITSLLPFSVGSLIVFIQWLSIFNIRHRLVKYIGSIAFVLQLILVLLFIFNLMEIALCWKWMFTLLALSIMASLHDLILRLTFVTKTKSIRIPSLVLALCSFLLSALYINNLFVSKLSFAVIAIYILFVCVNVWMLKEIHPGSRKEKLLK